LEKRENYPSASKDKGGRRKKADGANRNTLGKKEREIPKRKRGAHGFLGRGEKRCSPEGNWEGWGRSMTD